MLQQSNEGYKEHMLVIGKQLFWNPCLEKQKTRKKTGYLFSIREHHTEVKNLFSAGEPPRQQAVRILQMRAGVKSVKMGWAILISQATYL